MDVRVPSVARTNLYEIGDTSLGLMPPAAMIIWVFGGATALTAMPRPQLRLLQKQ